MDKRYQVFVSSTYEDLREERQEVMQALLELDSIPSGMELFPAANEDQWTLIKKVIDDCDYYLVIVGGRYGSIGKDSKSYTQMEYEYALSKDKPVIAFLHADPSQIVAAKTEKTQEGRDRLEKFRQLCQEKLIRFWSSPQELGSVVSRSIVKLIKTHPAVGWIRADELANPQTAQEILKLRKQIDDLEAKLAQDRLKPPKGSESLASGNERFALKFDPQFADQGKSWTQEIELKVSWNRVFKILSTLMLDKAAESELARALVHEFREAVKKKVLRDTPSATSIGVKLSTQSFRTIIVQLRALGLIKRDQRQRSIRDTMTYWTLTEYGDEMMTKLNAIRSEVAQPEPTIDLISVEKIRSQNDL
jgi:predicted transcriptional regulator